MKPEAQPCHRQDSRQTKDVQADRSRKEIWPPRHPAWWLHRFAAWLGQGKHPTTRRERPWP